MPSILACGLTDAPYCEETRFVVFFLFFQKKSNSTAYFFFFVQGFTYLFFPEMKTPMQSVKSSYDALIFEFLLFL